MITKKSMTNSITNSLQAKGYQIITPTNNLKMFSSEIIEAIAEGVVNDIQANAKAEVGSGSSAGSWSIK
ncbi:hypothetical protein AVBRAN12640_05330 [Campylobacter sp. RM12640]|uniref:hypothetical protein n=1 Tax=unclassified Campylobacter TaxID=2593542 RepID=UPI003015441D|nr:hypothetical protein [Campylobacter sp. RM12640]MBZ7989994.1 hypothetical protein [Campylobacter sp. RM12635]